MDFLGFFKKKEAPKGSTRVEESKHDGGELSGKEAREMIRKSRARPNMKVKGCLDLKACLEITELPEGLRCDVLDLTACKNLRALSSTLRVGRLILDKCDSLPGIPEGFQCNDVSMRESHWTSLSPGLNVRFKIDLSNSINLESIPDNLKVGSLILAGCGNLKHIGEGLEVNSLNITNCAALEELPKNGRLQFGRLIARNCVSLKSIPSWVENVSFLDIRGAQNIKELPEGILINSQIDLAGAGLQNLPPGAEGARILWNGVNIDERIAFRPEEITAKEVLDTQNVELRRVKLERLGYEKFFLELSPKVLDLDHDKGGERKLLKVAMEQDEDLVCVTIICPSTGRNYVIRVPPKTKTCREAVAWIAGFDNPNDYKPIEET